MIYYIIQTIAFQLFFLIIYDLFLKKETFFNWNRLYLLATAILSIMLPFVQINRFKDVIPQEYIISLPEIVIGQSSPNANSNGVLFDAVIVNHSVSFWSTAFYIGVTIASFIFLYKLIRIIALIFKNPKTNEGHLTLVKLINSNVAFSFFNYVFLGDFLKNEEKEAILKHELIHVKHWHSIDLLFFEILRVLFWFNPLIYMFQNRITALHEFIADAEAVKHQNKSHYYQNLLTQVFDTKNISFINPFFKQSLIKKRIVMLSKSKSKQIKLLKYVILFPVVGCMLVYTSCIQNAKAQVEVAEFESNNPIIKKINAIRKQIEIQGHVSDKEEKGLTLLLQIVKGDALNEDFIQKVQAFMSLKNKTKLEEKISDVFEQMQIQGNLNEEEEKALKGLLVLTSENGMEDPFFADVIKDVDIPFAIIEQPPIFPGCEELVTNGEKKACFSKNISNHINKNFNLKIADSLGIKGKHRINAVFKIDTEGQVVDVRSRSAFPDLEDEAIRVIKTLPKMIPGEQKGKKVNVPYSLPIIFQVAD